MSFCAISRRKFFCLGGVSVLGASLAAGTGSQSAEELDLNHYEMTFEDHFETLNFSPDPERDKDAPTGWIPEAGNGPNPSIELQRFIDPRDPRTAQLSPFSVKDSILTIEARLTPEGVDPALVHHRKILSGLMMTKHWFRQQYGYFEGCLKMPKGFSGNWPCFWLLPDDGRWPPEIDIVEQVGPDTGLAYLTIHIPPSDGKAKSQIGEKIKTSNLADDFHIFGVDWQADQIRYFIERKLVWSIATPPSFHLPMYLILNLSIGGKGSWTGESSLAPETFPRRFEIDYVRAYRRV